MREKVYRLFKTWRNFFVNFYLLIKFEFDPRFFSKSEKNIIFAFNIAKWKRELLVKIFDKELMVFVPLRFNLQKFHEYLSKNKNYKFLVWGVNLPESAKQYVSMYGVNVLHMEDGFVRSAGLGAFHILPHSICLDAQGIYFDARNPSDLENLLNNKDFSADHELMNEARDCLRLILERDITKYNLPLTSLAEKLYGKKDRPRILVIGQVEDDQSILFGCDRVINNNDMVRQAAQENPEAQIIYKIHPDVIVAKRRKLSNPEDVADLAVLIREPMSLSDALLGVDKVYTISSLAGFESLLRGVPVVTLGCPFYAGWGLTDSRQKNPRRTRKLSLDELFAGAYILYPKYFNPQTGKPSSLKETIENIYLELKK